MHSNASGSVPNSDTESPVVPSETGEQQEGAKRQGEFSDVDEADMEKAGSGQMDKNKERVQQAGSGGREATTSLPGKQEQGQRDQSGLQDDNAQKQASSPLKRHGKVLDGQPAVRLLSGDEQQTAGEVMQRSHIFVSGAVWRCLLCSIQMHFRLCY